MEQNPKFQNHNPHHPDFWTERLKDIPDHLWIQGTMTGEVPRSGCALFHVQQSDEMAMNINTLQNMFQTHLRQDIPQINDAGRRWHQSVNGHGKRNILGALAEVKKRLEAAGRLPEERWRTRVPRFEPMHLDARDWEVEHVSVPWEPFPVPVFKSQGQEMQELTEALNVEIASTAALKVAESVKLLPPTAEEAAQRIVKDHKPSWMAVEGIAESSAVEELNAAKAKV